MSRHEVKPTVSGLVEVYPHMRNPCRAERMIILPGIEVIVGGSESIIFAA